MPTLQLKMGIDLGLDLTKLRDLSNFVDELANVPHHIRAPYVGSAAFTHKGGLHVHAVQKLARTYEHVDPALVGNSRVITISDMAGQSNVIVKAETMGFKLQKGSDDVAKILSEVKRLESEGYEFEAAEASFDLLIRRCLQQSQPLFDLLEYHCSFRRSGDGAYNKCEATVKIAVGDEKEYTVAEGDGPVNALDAALRAAFTETHQHLADIWLSNFKVRILDETKGSDATIRVLIEATDGVDTWGSIGVSTNLIGASWMALVDSLEYAEQPSRVRRAPAPS
jgi:2-isopropylmalate synthase